MCTQDASLLVTVFRELHRVESPGGDLGIADPGTVRNAWIAAVTLLALAILFLGLCVGSLLGVVAAQSLPIPLLTLGGAWLVGTVAFLGRLLPARERRDRSPGWLRWDLLLWIWIPGLVLAPILGQVVALHWAVFPWLKHSRLSRSRAIVLFIVALGWPAMFLCAIGALSPLFRSSVVLGSGVTATRTLLDVTAPDHLNPVTSVAFVYGAGTLLWLVATTLAIALWRHQRRRARQVEHATGAGTGTLRQGGCAVVVGKVALAEGHDLAVRVEVLQRNRRFKETGGWRRLSWRELERRTLVEPFALLHESGEPVWVEPTEDTLLMRDLDSGVPVDKKQRIRSAELVCDERVILVGSLHRSDARPGWVLGPPDHGKMLISEAPLERPFRRRASGYGTLALLLLLVGMLGHAFLLPFHLSLWTATPRQATVESGGVWRGTNCEGDARSIHTLRLAVPEVDRPIRQDVSHRVYYQIPPGSRVPVRHVALHADSSQLGELPTVKWEPLTVYLVFLLALIVIVLAIGQFGLQWYETDDVTDLEDETPRV